MIVVKIVSGVRSHFVRRLPEWLLAAHIGAWGCSVAHSPHLFESSRSFAVMATIASERTWGAIALSLSLFWFLALFLNGTFRWFAQWSRWIRSLSAFVTSGFWITATLGFLASNPSSPAAVNTGFYALIAFSVSLITAREVGAAGAKVKHGAARKP